MKKLSLLILCLLVACKVFTQTDTLTIKPEYVFLTESQARSNIKELIAYDGLKLIFVEQENRIDNFQAIIAKYETVVLTKDSIISRKDTIIGLQEKIIKIQNRFKFVGYAGAEILDFKFNSPSFYFRTGIETKKINIGVQFNVRPIELYNMPSFYGTLKAEFKIF